MEKEGEKKSVLIKEEVWRELKHRCIDNDETISNFVEAAITEKLGRKS